MWLGPLPYESPVSGIRYPVSDGARLVHRYQVYVDNLPHQSLHGYFMEKLSRFTHQASAEARLAAKRGRDSSSESASTLLGYAHLPGGLHVPQSCLLPVPHLILPLQPRLHSFFRSRTPLSCWRLLMARCLRACRCLP